MKKLFLTLSVLLSAISGLSAIYVKQPNQSDKIYYVHRDHLGSILSLTDANGTAVFNASYDAWGKQTITTNTFKFHRGFTGHEHLPEFALINMNGRMYDPILGRFLSPDPYVQAPEFSQSFNRYSYCVNNPLIYTDPSGEIFGIDDAIVILAMAYFGGMQANFSYAAANNTNPFNPGNWNWESAHTYIGIAGGAMSGAGIAGYHIPYTQVPGMISNGALQAGIQVTLNGIGNLTDDRKFFDNWYWSAGMGFVSGSFSGYQLAQEKNLNYWWGSKVKYGRTQWSFLTAEKPYETISWDIKNVGSQKLNDCVPTSYAEMNDYFGGNTSYDEYRRITDYQEDVGVVGRRSDYERMLGRNFTGADYDAHNLADPQVARNIQNNGQIVHTNMPHSGIRHADNLRSISYYHSGKVVMRYRIGSYKLSSVNDNWWVYLFNGIR
jgi:RHS repeat-associated protein